MMITRGLNNRSFRIRDALNKNLVCLTDKEYKMYSAVEQMEAAVKAVEDYSGIKDLEKRLKNNFYELKKAVIKIRFEKTKYYEWLCDNQILDYKVTPGYKTKEEVWLEFAKQSDAILFKLTWGNGEYEDDLEET